MKLNFKKISAIASSVLLTGMTLGIAAAAAFPAPFKTAGATGTAVVYGSGADAMDATQANSIANYLAGQMPSTAAPTGDSVLLAKSSDNINLGDTWSGVYTGTIDDEDLKTILVDGTYVADDNDEFDFEQTIKIGSPRLEHFRDSDYEELVGLSTKTPTVGFKLVSGTWVMNYTYDFITDAESSVDANGKLDDIDGSDIKLLGKTFYVSELLNGSSTTTTGKLTLLDAANTGIVSEGETVTVTAGGKSYEVSLVSLTTTEAKFTVNGETTNALTEGSSFRLSDDSYLGVKDIYQRDVSGVTGNVEFSIGSGKLEMTSGSEIKLNDETVDGVYSWVYKGAATSNSETVSKITIEWKTDEEMFLAPAHELLMPGFEAIKFTTTGLVRPTEEKITIEKDSDTSMQISVPIKDGTADINILYSNASGDFRGIGKDADEKLATSPNNTLVFHEKFNGLDHHAYFVASYNVTAEAESYLLRAKVSYDSTALRNETTIDKYASGGWTAVCEEKIKGGTCDIGDVSLVIDEINYVSGGNESVTFRGGTGVNFNTVYTTGGMRIWLPYDVNLEQGNGSSWGCNGNVENGCLISGAAVGALAKGAVNLTNDMPYAKAGVGATLAGHNPDSFWLFFDSEDKDDNIAAGLKTNLTIDATSTGPLQVSQIAGAGSGGTYGLEIDESSTYETYFNGSAVGVRALHYTNPDEDYAEIYYPTGDSETYANVYIAEAGASATSANAGSMIFTDSEKASWSNKDVVIVGGSCINTAAAEALGVASGTCASAFTTATGVGTGQYLIQSVGDKFTTGKIALVVAGYSKDDTAAAASKLVTVPASVDTTAGKKYIGIVGVQGTSTFTEA